MLNWYWKVLFLNWVKKHIKITARKENSFVNILFYLCDKGDRFPKSKVIIIRVRLVQFCNTRDVARSWDTKLEKDVFNVVLLIKLIKFLIFEYLIYISHSEFLRTFFGVKFSIFALALIFNFACEL